MIQFLRPFLVGDLYKPRLLIVSQSKLSKRLSCDIDTSAYQITVAILGHLSVDISLGSIMP